jgi:hypothetical protein
MTQTLFCNRVVPTRNENNVTLAASSIRAARSGFYRTKKARGSTKVQVVIAMTLDQLARERVFYHKTQLELLCGRNPIYVSDTNEPFEVWIAKRRRNVLNWTTLHAYAGIPMVSEFFSAWRPIMLEAVELLNELTEIQALGRLVMNSDSDIAFSQESL